MIRRSLLRRLYLGYVALVVLLALLASALLIPGLRRASEDDVRRSLEAQTAVLAEWAGSTFRTLDATPDLSRAELLRHPGVLELGERVALASERAQTRYTLVRPDGSVIVDSHEPPESLGDHSQRPELRDALLEGEGVSIRYSRTLRENLMYFALPVVEGGRTIGLARASVSLASIDDRVAALRFRVAGAALLALLVALVSGWWLGRRITLPLRQVTAAVRAMRRGEYDQRIRIDADDEIGTLAHTFNEMSAELEQRIEELQRDRNRTLAILGGMTEGVIAVDADERVVQLNAAAARMLEIGPEAVAGRPVWEVVRVTEVCRLITEAVRRPGQKATDLATIASVGARHLELGAATLRDSQGASVGAVLVLHDITRVRHLESVRRDFVTNVSHELKTPLAAISGFLGSMIDDPEMDGATRQRFLTRAQKQAQRLDNLVRDLLRLSRAEHHEVDPEEQLIEIRGALERATESLASAYEAKGVGIAAEFSPEEMKIRADEESLRQIFDNLLTNAARYTDAGGKVTVRALATELGITVEVEDTGVGIEARHHDRIFERFYRVDSSRSRELGGTGLGLAICKHTVERLGGSIRVESSPGEGTLFRVELPRVH